MLRVYINYPNAKISLHGDNTCGHIQQARKRQQRSVQITDKNLERELHRFKAKYYRFGASAEVNDMWLDIHFDPEKNLEIVHRIHEHLKRGYGPFRRCRPVKHCDEYSVTKT